MHTASLPAVAQQYLGPGVCCSYLSPSIRYLYFFRLNSQPGVPQTKCVDFHDVSGDVGLKFGLAPRLPRLMLVAGLCPS